MFAMTSMFSWQNSVSFHPVSFCTLRPNLPVTPGISWLPTFAFQSPMMNKTCFFAISLGDLLGLHRTYKLQLLLHLWLEHRVALLGYWMGCSGNELRSFCHFQGCTQVLHFDSFVNYEGYSISSKGFLPAVVDIIVIRVKFTYSHLFAMKWWAQMPLS